ncbi:hypothetical protein Are01nite_14610 [Actinoplanes regularis]|nr:hypothetical protein Are01nite_14610 [Actinoplanes regularis]
MRASCGATLSLIALSRARKPLWEPADGAGLVLIALSEARTSPWEPAAGAGLLGEGRYRGHGAVGGRAVSRGAGTGLGREAWRRGSIGRTGERVGSAEKGEGPARWPGPRWSR